jgi:hypothetical protein
MSTPHLDCCTRALELVARLELANVREGELASECERWEARVRELETRLGGIREMLEGK